MTVASEKGDKALVDFFHEKGPENPMAHWRHSAEYTLLSHFQAGRKKD